VTSFVQSYGLAALFVVVTLESCGVPVPGETALVAAGVFASRGHLDITEVIVVAAVAAILGDNIGYWIGRTGGRSVIARWRHSGRTLAWAESFFRRHGAKTIFLARFFSILRVTAAWMAGVSRMHWWTFFLWNAAGAICWAVLVGLVSYYLGDAAASAISRYGLIGGVAIVAVAALGFVAVHYWRKRLVEESS
jgi:membrane protein DedA with SNARE-associated domain